MAEVKFSQLPLAGALAGDDAIPGLQQSGSASDDNNVLITMDQIAGYVLSQDSSAGGAGISDGDKGDVTVSSSGSVWTIDNDAVTYAKMQNVSAASKLLGRGDSGSGDPQEITLGTGLAMSGTTLNASGGSSDFVKISEVVTTASQSTITFSSIAATYRHLKLVVNSRGTNATIAVTTRCRINGDTGANYAWKYFNNAGSASATADTAFSLGETTAANSPASNAGGCEVLFKDYRSTVFHKNFVGLAYTRISTAATDAFPEAVAGNWSNTAAITSLTLTMSAGNFVDGSVASLYGLM